MEGSSVMGASVRIEDDAFDDSRYAELAEICGLSDADHARGKMLRIWRQCILEGVYVLPIGAVNAVLGPNGADALVSSRLGVAVHAGIRVRGTEGKIEWLKRVRDASRKGGGATKAKWHADRPSKEGPQIADRPSGGPGPDQASGRPQEERDLSSRSSPEIFPDPEYPHSSGASGVRDLVQQRGDVMARAAVVPSDPGDKSRAFCDIDSQAAKYRRSLQWRVEKRLNEEREGVAVKLKLEKPPWVHPTPNATSRLNLRVQESGENAERNIDHVIKIAVAEALRSRSLKYLGWCIFEDNSWTLKIQQSVADAERGEERNGKPAEVVRPRAEFDEPPIEVELSDDDREALGELARKIAADPTGGKP